MAELGNEPDMGDNSNQEPDGPTLEALQEQLEQKEQDIKYLKDNFSAQKQELLEAQKTQMEKVSKLEGRFEERDRLTAEPPVDPYELSEEMRDKFADNPSLITGFVKDRVDESVDVIVQAFRERDAMYKEQLAEIKGTMDSKFESVNPEKLQWKEAISTLKENDAFKGLPTDTLIAIAKEKDMRPSMEYRGSAGGQRTRETPTTHEPVKFSPEVPGYRHVLKIASGDVKMAESIWNRMEKAKVNGGQA